MEPQIDRADAGSPAAPPPAASADEPAATGVADAPARGSARTEPTPSSPARSAPTSRELRQDYALAAGMFIAALVSGALSSISEAYGEQTADLVWVIPLSVGTCLPLAVRKKYPIPVAFVVCASYFLGVSFYVPEVFAGNIAMFIAIYTIGAWTNDRRRAAGARAVIIVGMAVWLLVSTYLSIGDAADDAEVVAGAMSPLVAFMLLNWLINGAYFAGAYFMGDHAFRAALNRQSLQRLTRELEEERELAAEQAVALDRVRIARELHDVVGHHVSAMGVQAGAARTVMAADPDAAEDVLKGVESNARTAIDELHHLLDTLRDPSSGGATPSALHVADIAELARQANAAGMRTTFAVIGDTVPLTPLIETNLYRIAQEALTNARRHGGPHAAADVRLRWASDAVELEVTNTGRVRAGARPGIGQLGMRERATAMGGVLHFGRREPAGEGAVERSGYLVRVSVPLGENGQSTGWGRR